MAAGIAAAVLLLIIIIIVAVVVSTNITDPPPGKDFPLSAKACKKKTLNTSTDDWLMIVGGYNHDDESGYVHNFTLLLALEPKDNPVPPCLAPNSSLGQFPMHTAWMHGGTDEGSWFVTLFQFLIIPQG